MKRIAITAMGVCTPAGDLNALWNSAQHKRSHLGSLEDGDDRRPPRLVGRVHDRLEGLFPRRIEPGASRHTRLAARALLDCLGERAQVPTGLAFSSASQGQDLAETLWGDLDHRDSRALDQENLRTLTNSGATQLLASQFSLTGSVQSIDGASCAGALAVQSAMTTLQTGVCSRIAVVSGEANLFAASLAFYEKKVRMGGVTQTFFGRYHDASPRPLDTAVRPFGPVSESDRGAIGEAGAALVLETFESARLRGAPILAELAQVHSHFHTDGYHGTDRSHIGLRRVMEPVRTESIHSLHLPISGSWVLDIGLIQACSLAFPGCHAFSLEPLIGHTGAASGLLNIILAVRALEEGMLLPTRGLDPAHLEPLCQLAPSTTPLPIEGPGGILTISCGWGGWNSSALVTRAPS